MPDSTQHENDRSQPETHAQSVRLRDIPTEFVWKIAGALVLAIVLGVVFLDLLRLLIRPLGVLLAAVVVALTLAPLADILERRVPRMVAVVVLYLGLILILVGLGFLLFPPVISDASELVDQAPQYFEDAQSWLSQNLGVDISQLNLGDQVTSLLQSVPQYLISVPAAITSVVAELALGFFISLYWLYSMPRMKAFVVSLFPPERQGRADEVMHLVSQRMGGYLQGVAITGLVVGTVATIGLSLIGVQYALLLGVVAFLGEFIPNIGPVLAGIPAVGIALFESPTTALIVLVFYIVLQQVESYLLAPVIMRQSRAGVPPLVTTFAVFAGFFAGGILWALLAIPVSGAILTLVTELVAPAIRRRTGASEPQPEQRRQQPRPEPAGEKRAVSEPDQETD